MYENHIAMSSTSRTYRHLALYSSLALLMWVGIWQLLLSADKTYGLVFIFLFYLLPLILPLKGIIKARPYTHAWSSFVVLLYIMHAITVFYAEPQERIYAGIELVLAILMFTGCAMFARVRGKELGLSLPKLKDVMEQEKQRFEG